MATTGHRPGGWAHPIGARRRTSAALARSVLLGAAVFTVAALTGVLLSGAAPAGPGPATAIAQVGEATPPAARSEPPQAAEPIDQVFAQSMIVSGAAALTVSLAGMAMVGRRRRLW